MSLEQIKKDGIAFFTEALRKWNRLIELYNSVFKYPRQTKFVIPQAVGQEADKIIAWFQENYNEHVRHSELEIFKDIPDGKKAEVDPIGDLVFRGSSFYNICSHPREFIEDLKLGTGFLRGHLGSIRNLKTLKGGSETETVPLLRIRKTLSRCNLVIDQLKRTRKGKTPFLVEDEYDLQSLVGSLLRLDFDDIRKEDYSPIYAGGPSRIDWVLKKENIVIEAKKTNENLRDREVGKQLLIDIAKYKAYPDARILVCFIYDPENWIENPEGLENDLEKQSTDTLKVEVIICPKTS